MWDCGDQAVGGSRSNGQKSGADLLDSIGEWQTSNKHADTETHDHNARRPHAFRPVAASDYLDPALSVTLSNTHVAGSSGCARGGMETDDLFHRDGRLLAQRRTLNLALSKFVLSG